MNHIQDKRTGRLIVLTVALGVFMWSFSAGIVTIALPTISQFLDLGIQIVSWIVIIHMLVLTSLLLIFGRIGDFAGYKNLFIGGTILFAASSYLCAISLNFYHLLFFRALMGVGSAMLLSMVPAIISTFIPRRYRGRAFGYISLATASGISLGYGVGGYVTEFLGWRWIFFASIPLALLTILMANRFLSSFKVSNIRSHFDLKGALIIFIFLVVFILSVDMGDKIGWFSPIIITGFIASLLLALAFLFCELKSENPLFDFSILKNFYLGASITGTFMANLVLTGTIFLLPFYLELVMGYETDFAGLIIFLPTLFVIIIGPLSGYVSDLVGSKTPIILASIALAVALVLLAFFDPTLGLVFIFLVLAIRTLSQGMFGPANNKMIMSHAPENKVSMVSSLLNTASYMGLVIGVVLFQTIFDSYITGHNLGVERLAVGSAIQISAPVSVLLDGFQAAFMLGVVISICMIVLSLLSKENKEPIH